MKAIKKKPSIIDFIGLFFISVTFSVTVGLNELPAEAAEIIVDQKNLVSDGNLVVVQTQIIGQSFQVGLPGMLVGIEIAPLLDTTDPNDEFLLELFDSNDQSLGTTSIRATNFQTGGGTPNPLLEDTIGPGFFNLSDLDIQVSAGDMLRFEISHSASNAICEMPYCIEGIIGNLCFGDEECYRSGRAGISADNYTNGTAFIHHEPVPTFDLAFKTFVTPDRVVARKVKLKYIPLNWALRMLFIEGMPWCPPGLPGCRGNRLSIDTLEKDPPIYMPKLDEALLIMAKDASDTKSLDIALTKIKSIIKSIPLGSHFDNEMKQQLFNLIDSLRGQTKKITYSDFLKSPIFIKSLNSIELDWRLPEITKQIVNKGEYIGVDISGIIWAGLRDVVEPGAFKLTIKSEYEVFPDDSKFFPSWPFLSYIIDFDGKLKPKGFMNLTFYIKPLRFNKKVSEIKVLRFDKEGFIDVTAGRDYYRGTVMAQTDRLGTFIIVGQE